MMHTSKALRFDYEDFQPHGLIAAYRSTAYPPYFVSIRIQSRGNWHGSETRFRPWNNWLTASRDTVSLPRKI